MEFCLTEAQTVSRHGEVGVREAGRKGDRLQKALQTMSSLDGIPGAMGSD